MYEIDEVREERDIQNMYDELVAELNKIRPMLPEESESVLRAFNLAKKEHGGVRRKSGEPYIFHPLSVAMIAVSEIGLGPMAAVCALLHDVVEDTDTTLDEIRQLFGERVVVVVDGVTKIDDVVLIQQSESTQAENYRKILLSMCNDVYVIFLKLCDRLHNMRTLDAMKDTKKLAISSETQYFYIPLAHRLGLYNIKTELEELVMKYTNPLRYGEISAKINGMAGTEEKLRDCLVKPIEEMLDASGYKYRIKRRVKSVYSCWKKMEKKGVAFDEIYDLYAMRIILDVPLEHEKEDCFKTYALISQRFKPHPDRFRDWITTPKNNGYESLQTTVMTPIGRWVEIQIRTERMDSVAEKGMAAHFLYKEAHPEEQYEKNPIEEWLLQIRSSLENPNKSALEVVEEFKEAMYIKEVYIFTPKGETVTLPAHSTVLDFAFAIHTDLGLHCIGAKVNSKVVPLGFELHSGEQVEVLKSRRAAPTEEWLTQVHTSRAKERLKDYLREQRKAYYDEGEKKLSDICKKHKIAVDTNNIARLRQWLNMTSEIDLFYEIAIGKVGESDVAKCFGIDKPAQHTFFLNAYKDLFAPKRKADTPIAEVQQSIESQPFLLEKDYERFEAIPAKCCNPVQGDQVVGIVTDDKIMVHRTNCKCAMDEMARHENHVVRAKWREGEKVAFLTGVTLTAIDRKGVLRDIIRLISSDMDLYIRGITLEASEGIGRGIIMVYVNDLDVLNNLIERLRSMDGVEEVRRI